MYAATLTKYDKPVTAHSAENLPGVSEPRTQRSGVSGQPLTPLRCVRGSERKFWRFL
jgi:hypothetical protein